MPQFQENKLYTAYPQKMWTTFYEEKECLQTLWGIKSCQQILIHRLIHKRRFSLDKLTVVIEYLKNFY
ncbi:hypothetical protein PMI05_01850 [Brevibacillus sp. BC25]|nr:hypothetical protein PMI05_01850 [Brevibacillus sp. BC25]